MLAIYCWVCKFGIGWLPHLDLSLLRKREPRALSKSISLDATDGFEAAGLVPLANLTCLWISERRIEAISLVFSPTSSFSSFALAKAFLISALYRLVFLTPANSAFEIFLFFPYLAGFLFPFFHSLRSVSYTHLTLPTILLV